MTAGYHEGRRGERCRQEHFFRWKREGGLDEKCAF